MFLNLLEGEAPSWKSYIPIIIIVVLLVAFFVWSFVSQKKKQKDFAATISAVKPGNKVKTIGGIVGEVVEVNDAEGTFVLKTGDSEGNYSYMKFDKQAIYQTDAKPEEAKPVEETAPEQVKEEAAPEEPFEENKEAEQKEEKTSEEKKDEESK